MIIHVKVFGPLLKALGKKTLDLDVPDGVSIREAIDTLTEVGGQTLHELIIDDGRINGNLIIMLNKQDVTTLSGEDTEVKDGDEIAILPPVQGG